MIFIFLAILAVIILLLLFFQTPEFKNWEAKRNERKIQKFQEQNKPKAAERKRFIREELFPAYKELFRNGPIGYWTDPYHAYTRVVVYKDWEFRADGTGDFIFFTVGGGESRSPFTWKSVGDYKIHMSALDPPENNSNEDDDENYFCSFIPREEDLTYSFVFLPEDSDYIRLQSDKYDSEKEEQPLGEVGLLSLSSSPIEEELKKRFPGKY